jgi:DNA-nicking Smr family endonuclease
VDARPAGLDSGTWERLRSGRLRPERKLDLHGRTVQAAHHAFHAFLARAHADRVRVVEVVTGRGNAGEAEARGRIRREFPVWLNLPEIRPLVLAAVHPHAANPGSVVLLLRRVR